MGYVHVMRSCGPVLRVWAGPFPNFMLFTPEAFEVRRSKISSVQPYNYCRHLLVYQKQISFAWVCDI
jgi:hypothetical protein